MENELISRLATEAEDASRKVLVVDDEELNRELLEDLLIPLGYEVTSAPDGQSALDMAAQDPPDVILLDVMMPGLNGFEVARKLRQEAKTQNTPIVMVTALKAVEDRVKALESGANDFLSKPVDKVELQATVASQMKVKAYHDFMEGYQSKLEAEVARRTMELRQALGRLKQSSLDTIMRLARAAEYKDEDTGAHILRMSSYGAAIARQMELGDEVAQWILYAAPMHDVGKIGIPDHILLKPGPLDEDEWVIMKTHTTIGGQILSGAKAGYLKLAEIIALTHHERWDGAGYPHGYKGDETPLVGRIAALSDVFDALTSKRPYKEAFSVEKSMEIIKEDRGTHFDPDVVDAFFAIQSEILEIKQKFSDQGDHEH
ncbi:MAG: response regulator [Desulfarculaceae bacterium]|nr:response regulator [Desulfarculaceae bacterium]MCF8071148.1 response regulator [Desulfarculaceae bacterium]MCF8101249.1 response regulator [Desulfarculaceae bacterium]MCF8115202.1 response regulator [Desulfarculaceae bacterium]